MAEGKSALFWIGVGIMIILIIGNIYSGLLLAEKLYPSNPTEFKKVSLFTTVLLVFILVLLLGYSNNARLDRGEMRRSMTAMFVVILLVILFFNVQIGEGLMNFFLGVLATIIGFYYGSRKLADESRFAADAAQRREEKKEEEEEQ